jgi:hypothetical protein
MMKRLYNFLSLAKTYNDIKLIGWIKDLGEAVIVNQKTRYLILTVKK